MTQASPLAGLHVTLLGAFAERATDLGIRFARWCVAHKLRTILLVLAVSCSLVGAQATGDATPQVSTQTASTYSGDMRDIDSTVARIASVVNNVLSGLASNSTLQGVGKYMTAFFVIAMLTWTTLKSLVSGRGLGELIGEWVPVFIGFGLVTLILDQNAGQTIVSTMDMVASAIAGSSMSTLDNAIRSGSEPIFKAIAAVVGQPRVAEGASGSGWTGWLSGMASGLASFIYAAVAKVIAAVVLTFAGVTMMAHIIMGFASIKLVLALAPMMVPFLMFPPASWIFDSWLRFLLGACMLKVVVAFLLTLVAGLLSAMNVLATQFYLDATKVTPMEALQVDILLLGMVMVFALLAALLMMQAPTIASGLLSGNAGGAGFKGMAGLTQSAGGRVVSNGTSGAASGTGGAAKGGFQQLSGHLTGKWDAQAGRPKSLAYRTPQAQARYNTSYRKNAPPAPPPPPPAAAPAGQGTP